MSLQTFEEYARKADLHTLSHRGLNRELIPFWLASGEKDLDQKIVSAAYGHTPRSVQKDIIELLVIEPEDTFLDFGAGGGGVIVPLLSQGISAFGLEQNRLLVEAGNHYLKSLALPVDSLKQGDFLTCPWPAANKVYSATSRFSRETLRVLSKRIQEAPSIQRVVALGQKLDLSDGWNLEAQIERTVCWNENEVERLETIWCWARRKKATDVTPVTSF